jgi:hypothetical protein
MTRPAISDIAQQYAEERFYGDDRAAAEYAYALAVRLREVGDADLARRYAQECLALASSLPSRSLDDVATARVDLGGVLMPGHFHDDIVRARLADLL